MRLLDQSARIEDFSGWVTRVSPQGLGPSQAMQANNTYTRGGMITNRKGIQKFGTLFSAREGRYLWQIKLGGDHWVLQFVEDSNGRLIRLFDRLGRIYPQYQHLIFGSSAHVDVASGLAGAYLVFGDERVYRLSRENGLAWNLAGILPPPEFHQILTVSPGENTPGKYSFRATYVNEALGLESAPGPEAVLTIPIGLQLDFGGLVRTPGRLGTPADGQVDGFRVYVKKDQVDSQWYEIRSRVTSGNPGGDNFDWDPNADTQIFGLGGAGFGAGSVPDRSSESQLRIFVGNGVPPKASAIAYHKNRMWYALAGTSQIRCSEYENPDLVDETNTWNMGDEEGDELVKLVSFNGHLWGFNGRSTYILGGHSPQSFVVEPRSKEVGCVAQHTVREANGYIWWAAEKGIYRDKLGGEATQVSQPIDKSWRGFDRNELQKAVALYDPESGHYIVSATPSANGIPGHGNEVGVGGVAENFQVAVNVQTLAWAAWQHDIRGMALLEDEHFHPQTIMSVDGGRRLGRMGGLGNESYVDWNRSTMSLEWRTGQIDFGTSRLKLFFMVALVFERNNSVSDIIRLGAFFDDDLTETLLVRIDPVAGASIIRAPIGRAARKVSFWIRVDSTSEWNIKGIEVQAVPIGRF